MKILSLSHFSPSSHFKPVRLLIIFGTRIKTFLIKLEIF